jgi:hypothetical protein
MAFPPVVRFSSRRWSVEWLPVSLRLRQPVGNRKGDGWVITHAAMAAFDLNAFGSSRRSFLFLHHA